MQSRGWFKFHRWWLDTPLGDDPDDLTLWLEILRCAAYKEGPTWFQQTRWDLRPGQCVLSERVLGRRWGFGKKKVRGFLRRMEAYGLGTFEATRRGTIVTIFDPDAPAGRMPPADCGAEPSRGPAADKIRNQRGTTKEEGEETLEEAEEERSDAARARPDLRMRLDRAGGTSLDELERYELGYFNTICRRSFRVGMDSEYLRERLAEGRSPAECELVAEAAVATGSIELHPRKVFSASCFDRLLMVRTNSRRWRKEHADDLDEAFMDALQPLEPS